MRDSMRRKTTTPEPDAWMQLVLRTMSETEIRDVLTRGEETDPIKLRWLKNELLKRTRQA